MGQQEVSDFLRQHRQKWFSSKEIARSLAVSTGSVINNLSKLRKSGNVSYKESNRTNQFLYKYKN